MKNMKVIVAIISNHAKNKFLMLRYQNTEYESFWYFPNDILLSDKNISDAAMKLVLKQTDVRCRIKEELCCFTDENGAEWHFIAGEHLYGQATPLAPEAEEAYWYSAAEIKQLLAASLPPEVKKFLGM